MLEVIQNSKSNIDWQSWWEALAKEPDLQDLFVERDRRFQGRHTDFEPIFDLAGFREVGSIWQTLDDRVLLLNKVTTVGAKSFET